MKQLSSPNPRKELNVDCLDNIKHPFIPCIIIKIYFSFSNPRLEWNGGCFDNIKYPFSLCIIIIFNFSFSNPRLELEWNGCCLDNIKLPFSLCIIIIINFSFSNPRLEWNGGCLDNIKHPFSLFTQSRLHCFQLSSAGMEPEAEICITKGIIGSVFFLGFFICIQSGTFFYKLFHPAIPNGRTGKRWKTSTRWLITLYLWFKTLYLLTIWLKTLYFMVLGRRLKKQLENMILGLGKHQAKCRARNCHK